jgi:hypothetical protein
MVLACGIQPQTPTQAGSLLLSGVSRDLSKCCLTGFCLRADCNHATVHRLPVCVLFATFNTLDSSIEAIRITPSNH